MNIKNKSKTTVGEFIAKYPIIGTLGLLIVMSLFFIITSPPNRDGANLFISFRNIKSIFELSAGYSIGAFAMTMVLLSGGIDLSCGSVIAFSGMVTAAFMSFLGCNFIISAAIGLLTGVIIGLINAFLIVNLKVPPFLATLGVANALQGASFMMNDGLQIYIDNPAFENLFGYGTFLGIPALIWWTAFFLLLSYFIIKKMKFGRRLQATGGNERAAMNSGINVKTIKYITYAYMGFVSAFVSMTLLGRLSTALPNQGADYELTFIVCAVLGGTDFVGGGGDVFGAFIGSLIIAIFSNGENLLGVDGNIQVLLDGLIIILAIVASVALSRKRAK